MADLVVWTGPVAPFQVPGATLAGATDLFIDCCGDLTPPCKPPTCPTIGAQLERSPDELFSRSGLARGDIDLFALAAFSAGGSILKRVLENPDYRALVDVVHAADAMWTASWQDAASRSAPPIEGYVEYGVNAASDPTKLFVATSSPSVNKSFATGIENMASIRREIERRTGKLFSERADFFGIDPAPERVYQLGNVIFAEYPAAPLGHGHTKIAPQVWSNIIAPWVRAGRGAINGNNSQPPIVTPPDDAGPGLFGVALGIAVAAGAYWAVRKWSRR